jgi:hypothetical protein
MARRCHRQKTRPHFIFIAEQFLGGGLHWASQDSREFLDALRFIARLSGGDAKVGGVVADPLPSPSQPHNQLVEMVKFTVILAWVSTGSAP